MIETFFLFLAIFALEIILEIDNVTALRKAAEGLPDTPMCRGETPHALALAVRVGLAYFLFNVVAAFSRMSASSGHNFFEQLGGVVIILVAFTLIINYFQGGKAARSQLANRMKAKKTNLVSFLIADAFLSLDTVIAAVAMTTSFSLAVTAMVGASICIMLFHKPLLAWLNLNPRMALIAFCVIGMLGVNLLFASEGFHIPKYALLLVVFVGIWLDNLDKDTKRKKAEELAIHKKRTNGVSSKPKQPSTFMVDSADLKSQSTARASRTTDKQAVVESVLVPKTVDASWAEVVQKSEQVRSLLRTEQTKTGGAFDFAPDGKRILPESIEAPMGSVDIMPAREQVGYVYGTTHSAGVEVGRYGFIFMGNKEELVCRACGAKQHYIVSICSNCGYYRFMFPAGIFEVGSLRLLTMRA